MTRYPNSRPSHKRCSCCWIVRIRAGSSRRKCQECRDARCRAPGCNVVNDRWTHPESVPPSEWRARRRRSSSVQAALDSTMIEPSESVQGALFDMPPQRRQH